MYPSMVADNKSESKSSFFQLYTLISFIFISYEMLICKFKTNSKGIYISCMYSTYFCGYKYFVV